MPSREILLAAFGVACVGYIAWMDFRPFALRRLSRVPEAIAPRELTLIFSAGEDHSLKRDKWSTIAPRVRLKNTTSENWNVRIAHWVFALGDDTAHALDSSVRPIHSSMVMAGDEDLVRFPAMPWRKAIDSRSGALSFKLVFWHGRGPAQFELHVVYNFTLDQYGSELGREATQIIEDVTQQRTAAYARFVPVVVPPKLNDPPPTEKLVGS